jgi:hypothetical protein
MGVPRAPHEDDVVILTHSGCEPTRSAEGSWELVVRSENVPRGRSVGGSARRFPFRGAKHADPCSRPGCYWIEPGGLETSVSDRALLARQRGSGSIDQPAEAAHTTDRHNRTSFPGELLPSDFRPTNADLYQFKCRLFQLYSHSSELAHGHKGKPRHRPKLSIPRRFELNKQRDDSIGLRPHAGVTRRWRMWRRVNKQGRLSVRAPFVRVLDRGGCGRTVGARTWDACVCRAPTRTPNAALRPTTTVKQTSHEICCCTVPCYVYVGCLCIFRVTSILRGCCWRQP